MKRNVQAAAILVVVCCLCMFNAGNTAAQNPFTSGTINVPIIWYTFEEVLDDPNSSEYYPAYADSMIEDIAEFFDWQSMGELDLDMEIIKRAGADSAKFWVIPDSVTSNIEQYLYDMLPDGWDDDADAVVRIGTLNPGGTYGGNTDTYNDDIRITFGLFNWLGDWQGMGRAWVQYVFVHEWGHMMGLSGHLAGNVNGESGPGIVMCPTGSQDWGQYYSCYGIMGPGVPDQALRCPEYEDSDVLGLIPYHPWRAIDLDWYDVETLDIGDFTADTTITGFELGDLRRHGEMLVLKKATNEFFVLTNHQRTQYDDILNSRGLAIWHIGRLNAVGQNCIFADLELQSGKWTDSDEDWCPDTPETEDNVSGADELDCESGMYSDALWSGLTAHRSFGRNTNPSSYWYDDDDVGRNGPQSEDYSFELTNIRASIDGTQKPEKIYKITFDVKVNVD